MREIKYIFEEFTEDEKTFPFADLLKLFREKTGKNGMSTFYGFVRELKAYGVAEELKKSIYVVNLKGVRDLDANR